MDIQKLDSEFLHVVTTDFNETGKEEWKEYCRVLRYADSIESLEERVCDIAATHEECATTIHNKALYTEINTKLQSWLQPDEKIFFYCSTGILAKLKEGYALTNRNIIIFNKKTTYVISYGQLNSMEKSIVGPAWILNGDVKMMLQAIAISPIELARILALVTMYAYKNRQGDSKLIISKQIQVVY